MANCAFTRLRRASEVRVGDWIRPANDPGLGFALLRWEELRMHKDARLKLAYQWYWVATDKPNIIRELVEVLYA
jgi:hypothetical protein